MSLKGVLARQLTATWYWTRLHSKTIAKPTVLKLQCLVDATPDHRQARKWPFQHEGLRTERPKRKQLEGLRTERPKRKQLHRNWLDIGLTQVPLQGRPLKEKRRILSRNETYKLNCDTACRVRHWIWWTPVIHSKRKLLETAISQWQQFWVMDWLLHTPLR